jgi:hypothetical protein
MKDLIYIVTKGLTSTTLEHSPDGWDDSVVNIERSLSFYGIFRSYTVSLKFMLDGASLLRNYFYSKETEDVKLVIKKLDRMTLTYQTIFTGIFDFTKFVDTDYYVEIVINDKGLSNLIKSNLENEYYVTFLTSNSFRIYAGSSYTTVEFIYFSRLLSLILDRATNGGVNQGIYEIDDQVLTAEEAGSLRKVLTNHNALKGFKMFNAKTSLKDVLKALFVLHQITASVETVSGKETLVLKKLDAVFSHDNTQTLTSRISDFKLSIASDFIFDRISIGHPSQDYGDMVEVNREFNCTSIFKSKNIMNVNSELDLVSPYRADWKGMKDSKNKPNEIVDEDELFVGVVQRVPPENYLKLEDGVVYNPSLLPAQAWHNTRISPRHLLQFHQNFIDSCRYGGPGLIEFISSSFVNNANNTTYAGIDPGLNEGSGFEHGSSSLFIPLYAEFTTDLPADIIITVTDNPYSDFEFQYNGSWFSGYLIGVGLKLHGKSSAKFKLLLSPSTDLSKLIR